MQPRTRTEQCRLNYRKSANRAPGREERLDPNAIHGLLELTHNGDAETRVEAIRSLCPCHVQSNHADIWNRLIELASDPDVRVRKTVFHTFGDGSPREREEEVIATLEAMYQDPDVKLRRQVRHLLAQYRRTGKINIL